MAVAYYVTYHEKQNLLFLRIRLMHVKQRLPPDVYANIRFSGNNLFYFTNIYATGVYKRWWVCIKIYTVMKCYIKNVSLMYMHFTESRRFYLLHAFPVSLSSDYCNNFFVLCSYTCQMKLAPFDIFKVHNIHDSGAWLEILK